MTLGAADPRRLGMSPPERTAIAIREARTLATETGPGQPNRWHAPAFGSHWGDYGSGQRPVGEADYPDLSRLRGLARVADVGGITLGDVATPILTVAKPPFFPEIFDAACYAQGAGYCVVRVDIETNGDVVAVACLSNPGGITTLANDSWISLAAIEWERDG